MFLRAPTLMRMAQGFAHPLVSSINPSLYRRNTHIKVLSNLLKSELIKIPEFHRFSHFGGQRIECLLNVNGCGVVGWPGSGCAQIQSFARRVLSFFPISFNQSPLGLVEISEEGLPTWVVEVQVSHN